MTKILVHSLPPGVGYVDVNKHQTYTLPYIHIHLNKNKILKLLIDTGSNKSFLNPEFVHPSRIRAISPISVKTMFNTHEINQKVIVPGLMEFKTREPIEFLLFKFHKYFDGLIGLETMQQLGITLDLSKSILKTDNDEIPLLFKPNYSSKVYTILPRSKLTAELPVDVENGDVYITPTTINDNLIIPEGIYHCKNWYAVLEIVNYGNKSHTFVIEQPIKAELFKKAYRAESHHCNIQDCDASIQGENISNLIRIEHLNSEERTAILKLCHQYEELFLKTEQRLIFTNNVKHEINLKDDKPVFTKSYRYPHIQKEEVKSQIDKMLRDGIIRPSFSPWSSPIWIVPKKADASGKVKWRLVIDYRKLNEKTIEDRYPLPNITDILDKLGKCMYFSTLDLASGFHQIEVRKQDIPKTAFSVDHGHYEYIRMPFGLKNAPSTFQRVMDNVLGELQGKSCLCYMDDIIVFSTSLQEHIESLKQVFNKLRKANLKVQMDKSEFLHSGNCFFGPYCN